MPSMFAVADLLIGNPAVATFAAFGSFAMLLLVEFSGSMIDRVRSQLALVAAGAAFVCLGTLASRATWLATVSMLVVGFCVLFAGVVSSVLAAATVSLLLAFILPVSIAAPASQIPDRLAGWGLAGAASVIAITVLWPAPVADRLRAAASAASRGLARRLRADAQQLLVDDEPARAEKDEAMRDAAAAVAALDRLFLATPYRPAGLSSAARAVVQLVDEISWLNAIVVGAPPHPVGMPVNRRACAVKIAAADALERGAELLDRPVIGPDALEAALGELRVAVERVESSGARDGDLVSALDPGFRAQEIAFAVSQIGGNIDVAAVADRRPWHQRLFGQLPGGLPAAATAAQRRALSHLEPHSVWLHNSLRGAAGLALAVLVASIMGVQHSFWVILGALSVLRSNALSTGQNVFRGLVGTAVGVVIGAALVTVVGTNTTVLWILLPLAVLCAGFAPAAVSFAAGQAAFTVTLVILFNIIEPTGWHVGLIRIEDAALGFAISLVVGVLFWPRGAMGALRRELGEAYAATARYLEAAVEFGVARSEPRAEGQLAASSARRLDDAFRTYLAERAGKPVPLAAVTTLVNGVVALRLAGDAVVDLWQRNDSRETVPAVEAGAELRAIARGVVQWYEDLADALVGRTRVPEPTGSDSNGAAALVAALGDSLGRDDALVARIVWTSDHLDAARRLQAIVFEPAGAAAGQR
jgi:uncharacterized membrane protein YccC